MIQRNGSASWKRVVEITDAKQKKRKNNQRNEDSLRELWDNIKHTNIHITGVPEEEKQEKGAENIFEDIIAENVPNLGKETNTQVQEAQRVPHRINQRGTHQDTLYQ